MAYAIGNFLFPGRAKEMIENNLHVFSVFCVVLFVYIGRL